MFALLLGSPVVSTTESLTLVRLLRMGALVFGFILPPAIEV